MNKRKGLLAALLVMLVTVAGISAYFTDSETVTNKFTVGNIDIELLEPGWDALPDADGDDIPDVAETVVPNQTITKDPTVKNVGTNDAYVFVELDLPYATVTTVDDEGNLLEENEYQPLFTFELNQGWEYVTTNGITGNAIYAYAKDGKMTALAANKSTPALFNSVTFANVINGQGLEGSTKQIIVNAKAIQTSELNNGVTDPEDIYQIITNQENAIEPEV